MLRRFKLNLSETMSDPSTLADDCFDFLIKIGKRIENIQTWLENEERTFRNFLSPLQSSRVGSLNPAQLDEYKEQIKLFQPQLKRYTRMLVEVLQQLSKFEIILKEIVLHFNRHGLNYLRSSMITIMELEKQIDEFSVRILTIFQIVTMFGNFHRQLQQLQD